MKIVIKMLRTREYVAELYLDDEVAYKTDRYKRPGCAARQAMNWLQLQHGAPDLVTLDMEWE